jgi:glycosyltransferase involved in cell wall biosynthesis
VLILWRSLPLVTTLHGREFLATRNFLLRSLMCAAYAHSRYLLVISRYSADLCLARLPSLRAKAIVAWNGASPWALDIGARRSYEVNDNDGPSSLTVVCAARLVERKNIAGAIAGFSQAASRHAGMTLIIAGDGPQRAELQRGVAAACMDLKIKFLGHIHGAELQKLYQTADVLLHPHSHHHDLNDVESFCLTIADGMAAGLGIISGKDGAPAEYINDGVSGLLVDGRSIAAIEDALSFMYLNPAARRQMGARAHEFAAANFHWAKHLSCLTDRFPD